MALLRHPAYVTLLVVVVHLLLLVPSLTKATPGKVMPSDDEEDSEGSGLGDVRTGLIGGGGVGEGGGAAGVDKDVSEGDVDGATDEIGIGGEGGGGGGSRDNRIHTTTTSNMQYDKGTDGGEGETADEGKDDGDNHDDTERKGDDEAGIHDHWSGSPIPASTIRPKSGTEAYHDTQVTFAGAGGSLHQQTTLPLLLLLLIAVANLLTTIIPTSPVSPYLL